MEATLLRRRGGAALSRCGPAGASEKLLLLEKDGSSLVQRELEHPSAEQNVTHASCPCHGCRPAL